MRKAKYICKFSVVVEPQYSAYGYTGYVVGGKEYRRFESLSNELQHAFEQDLGEGRSLRVVIDYQTPTGTRQAILSKENYAEGLSAIEGMDDDKIFTLGELLGTDSPSGDSSDTTDEEDGN